MRGPIRKNTPNRSALQESYPIPYRLGIPVIVGDAVPSNCRLHGGQRRKSPCFTLSDTSPRFVFAFHDFRLVRMRAPLLN